MDILDEVAKHLDETPKSIEEKAEDAFEPVRQANMIDDGNGGLKLAPWVKDELLQPEPHSGGRGYPPIEDIYIEEPITTVTSNGDNIEYLESTSTNEALVSSPFDGMTPKEIQEGYDDFVSQMTKTKIPKAKISPKKKKAKKKQSKSSRRKNRK